MAQPAPPRTPRRPAPARIPRTASARRKNKPSWLKRCILASFGLVLTGLAIIAWAVLARHFAPTANTSLTRFDAIIVLGYPADRDGNPTPTQLARVTEAVHEYERGVATHLILTGGPTANSFVEAGVMARTAHAQGIPDSAIFVEPDSRNTIQNTCFAVRIMKAHGWNSAEVVSSPYHLPRASLILSRLPLEWRTHPAPPLAPDPDDSANEGAVSETLHTIRYLVWTRQTERCEP